MNPYVPGTPQFWLRAALNCKEFQWDEDQREMAEDSLKAATAEEAALMKIATTTTLTLDQVQSIARQAMGMKQVVKTDIRIGMQAGDALGGGY